MYSSFFRSYFSLQKSILKQQLMCLRNQTYSEPALLRATARRCESVLLFGMVGNRAGVGITCGYGSGPYRMVCCPRSSGEEVPVRPTRRPTPTPTLLGNSEDCGLREETDWFQEYAEDTEALEATWPWMVAIKKWNSSSFSEPWCSGFLIDKTHVLSAAHCFRNYSDSSDFTAHIGSDDQDLAEKYQIIQIKRHEGYTGANYDDIAIITLAREVDVLNSMPICLPDDRMEDIDLTEWGRTVVGWGSELQKDKGDYFRAGKGTTLKQLDNLRIITNEECYQIYNEILRNFKRYFPRGITEEMLCAGVIDACGGDSGGPMMLMYKKRWYAVGVTSFGFRCGLYGFPSIYTKISSYMDWIKQNIENG